MPTKLTIEYIKEKISQRDDIELISTEYISNSTPLLIKCKIHKDHGTSKVSWMNIRKGCGCFKCSRLKAISKTKKFSLDKINSMLKSHVKCISNEYKDTKSKLTFKCEIHGVWESKWETVKQHLSCPKCRLEEHHNKIKHTRSDVINLINSNKNIEYVSGEYVNNKSLLEIRCLVNKNHPNWFANLNNINDKGSSCPKCSTPISKPELEMRDFIEQYVEIIPSSKSIITPYELDIYIPEKKIAIEFNGIYYHCDKFKDDNYHIMKREMCEEKGIQLIQIWETEWRDKRELVKSTLLAKLGIFNTRIYARKTTIKPITSEIAQSFLNRNHLMGGFKSAKHLGLYNNNILVSMVSYKKHKNGIDISRFCSELNTQVLGGLSKLLKEVERLNPEAEYIQYFVDLRYGGYGISNLGYVLEKTTRGFWWTDRNVLFNRLYCTANMDDRKLSQKEHAEELKLHKIYDAGQAKFIKNLT